MNALVGLNAVTLIFVALCVFAIGYRFYGAFMANKVLKLDKDRPMPSVTRADGIDYVKTNKYVLFGHHIAAIAAAGPLLGPVLAAQFGYLPRAFKRWYELLNIKTDVIDKWGEKIRVLITYEDLTVEEAKALRARLTHEPVRT